MLIDARQLADGTAIAGDVVVIGGGPAGIAASRRLADGGRRVVLLEGGGTEFDAAVQDLYAGLSVGLPYVDLDVTRLRLLGGSTNHWGNQVADFEPIDFTRRDWIPYSGWPVTRAELQPYYEQAFGFLDLGTWDLDRPERWAGPGVPFRLPDLSGRRIASKLFRLKAPALQVGARYLGELTASAAIRLHLHANAISLNLNADGTAIVDVDVATLAGKRFTATGAHYVLACGGLENPRLLLHSDRVQRRGIGNARDLVGRFFMDHLRIESGLVVPASAAAFDGYGDQFADPVGRCACLYLRPEAQAEHRTTVFRMKFQSRLPGETSPGYRGLRDMAAALKAGHPLRGIGTHLARMILDLDGMATGAYARAVEDRLLACVNVVEQAPNPDSRVMLADEVDALGLRRIRLDWRIGDLEKRTLASAQRVVGTELAAAGLGRMQLAPVDDPDLWAGVAPGANAAPAGRFEVGHHHTGTTRMAGDPSLGVVDRDCRVFGVGNLFVAGSSVFPTLGSANPTLTIVALALRLADHIRAQPG